MDEKQAALSAQRLYDTLFMILTGSAEGEPPAYDPDTTFLTLHAPGLPIQPDAFGDPWSPGHPDGSPDAARRFSALVDDIPAFSALHAPSGRRVSDLRERGPRRAAPAIPARQETEVLACGIEAEHDRDEAAWRQAQAVFLSAYMNAMASAETRKTWPMLAPALAGPARTAYRTWRSRHAGTAEAARPRSGAGLAGPDPAEARTTFDRHRIPAAGTTAPTADAPCSEALPSDWLSPGHMDHWPVLRWTSRTAPVQAHSGFTAHGGAAGFGAGLWSVHDAAGRARRFHSAADPDGIELECRWALVGIRRPWLSPVPFASPGQGREEAPSPLLPVAFLAVRDVIVKAGFSRAELAHARREVRAGGVVGWGPFSVSGGQVQGTLDAGGFTVPGVQIIGWVNRIVP